MDYKKIIKDNYTLHLIKTDRFKTINIGLKLTKEYNKEEYAYLNLLARVLPINGTKNYKTVNDITKKLESLYNTGIYFKSLQTSKNMSFEASLRIVNPKYTEISMYKESISMLKEIITNPLIKNNEFNYFDVTKNNLINSIKNIKDNLSVYSSLKFNEIFYKGTIYEENSLKNLPLYEKLTNKNMYKYYLKLFNSFKIDVFVIGDYLEDEILSNVDDLLEDFRQKDTSSKELYISFNPKKSKDKDKFTSTQSSLLVGLTINNLTEEEKFYTLLLYNTILGSMNNSVLFVNVREKNSLCYHISSTISKYTSSIIINSGINKTNYEKAVSLIEESLKSMTDEKMVNGLITNAKKTLNLAFNDFYENPAKIVGYYYLKEFDEVKSIEERREKINNLTSKEISSLAKKVQIKEIFLMEGVNSEEN